MIIQQKKNRTNPYIPLCLRPPILSFSPPVSLAGFPLFFCLAVGETKRTKDGEETVSFSSTVVSGGVAFSIEHWADSVDGWCSEN